MTAKGAPLVSSQIDQTVREYNGITGAFVRVAASSGALGHPLGVVIGVDGNLLVSNGQTNQVKRYDGSTGAFIDVFASTNLVGPTGMTIHHGALSVANSNPPQGVQRFDATTGVNTGNFVPSLANPSPRDEVAVEAAAGAGRDGGSARGDADEAGGGTRPRSHRVAPGRSRDGQGKCRVQLPPQPPEAAADPPTEGRYLLRTNLTENDPALLWQYYTQLVAVEEAFKNLKGDLAIRPIFHQEERRVEAHIFIAFAAASPACLGARKDHAQRAREVRRRSDDRCPSAYNRCA